MTIQEMPFLTWWREANDEMIAKSGYDMNLGDARYWYERNHSPGTAARLQIENEDSTQEERSYYDDGPCRFEDTPRYRADMIAAGRGRLVR